MGKYLAFRLKIINFLYTQQDKGDTGIRLQYTHSRLCSLEKNCGIELPKKFEDVINDSTVLENEMIDMLREIARFREVLQDCSEQLEPCILVRYLFDLRYIY